MNDTRTAPPPPDCLRCHQPMTPSSLGLLRPFLTPPGRSRWRRGVSAHVYVCSHCGHVEMLVEDPSAFRGGSR
ncbi:MAG TPA: hypothetical protein VH877_00455 [Polyangia bacterium]|nr:hypothetical protein [Polyangia bacterium]